MADGGRHRETAQGMTGPSSREPAPVAFQLLLIAIGLGLLPLFSPETREQGGFGRALVGAAFIAWAALVGFGLAQAVLFVLPAMGAEDQLTALGASLSALEPNARLFALYLGLSLVLFLVSLGGLYVSSRRARGASMFSALYTLVAAFSATMSSFTSFLGVQLVFQTETASLFSNWVLPALLSAFVFVYALALWVGGGDAVHTRHWTPGGARTRFGCTGLLGAAHQMGVAGHPGLCALCAEHVDERARSWRTRCRQTALRTRGCPPRRRVRTHRAIHSERRGLPQKPAPVGRQPHIPRRG